MRIQEMFYLVNHALETWVDPQFREKSRVDHMAYSLCNAAELVSLLNPLRPFPEISMKIDKIYSTDDTFRKGETGIFTSSERSTIINTMNEIQSNLLAMRSMCEALGVECVSSGFDIKLPPNLTLAELSKCTRDLDNVFSQCPILQSDNEKVKLRGVDVGSIWITFSIIGVGAATAFFILKNLAAMVDKIMVIRDHSAVCRQNEELARQMQIGNDMLQAIVETNNTIIKKLTQKAAEELASENSFDSPESIERIRGSIDILKGWMEKGMEIYPAIDAPKEIKAAFPPLEMQALPDFQYKQLEARKDEDTE